MNWIKSKVVMLPTEKATILYKFEETNKLIFSNHPNQHELATPQHLYFLSDEKIEKGDWVYNPIYKTVYQWIENADVRFDKINAKKIIATTNKSLGLPGPSKGFLEVYVDAYNEGKKIEEVLVEMEDFGEEDWVGDDYTGEPIWRHDWRIKVKPDNTITIKKVKDSWSKEEIIELFHKYKIDHDGEGCYYKDTLNRWIEQNL